MCVLNLDVKSILFDRLIMPPLNEKYRSFADENQLHELLKEFIPGWISYGISSASRIGVLSAGAVSKHSHYSKKVYLVNDTIWKGHI